MKILMLSGVFAKENEHEVVAHARAAVEFSANVFQQKLIGGFRKLAKDFRVISAPFVGAYPNASDIFCFRGFGDDQSLCEYVPFNNVWGLRNFSRAAAMKRAVRSFAQEPDPEKLIVIYCPHTPFLEAAVYAKKLDPRIRICLYVPDLPQYMNLTAGRSWFYDFAKCYDISVMHRLMKYVDSYVLLTEQMKDRLPMDGKPYAVIEGLVSEIEEPAPYSGEKIITYTGKLNEKFGIKALVDAFSRLEDPDCRLVLCGRGDAYDFVRQAAEADSRIRPLGQVLPEEALQWQKRAAVLVNPRPGNEDYTKYSFPSKDIEYLLTGKGVVGYLLDGMPREYEQFLFVVCRDEAPEQAIAKALKAALTDKETAQRKYQAFRRYARQKLLAESAAKTILRLSGFDQGDCAEG